MKNKTLSMIAVLPIILLTACTKYSDLPAPAAQKAQATVYINGRVIHFTDVKQSFDGQQVTLTAELQDSVRHWLKVGITNSRGVLLTSQPVTNINVVSGSMGALNIRATGNTLSFRQDGRYATGTLKGEVLDNSCRVVPVRVEFSYITIPIDWSTQ